mgnify:CR=1 FL=1
MNYFAHGRHFVDDPYFLAGTAVPDWLNVVDRRVRVRSHHAKQYLSVPDEPTARVAAGILRHCEDDAWFHNTRAFAELSLTLCGMLREQLPDDEGFRPHFLGHILVEILLDATLAADDPARLEAYYTALDRLDADAVAAAVDTIAPRPAANLGTFIGLFSRERFLFDYSDDGKLLFRLNQVMRRVGLPLLPRTIEETLAAMRPLVADRQDELLAQPSVGTRRARSPDNTDSTENSR